MTLASASLKIYTLYARFIDYLGFRFHTNADLRILDS